ncbi:HD domain-containing protein [Halanaeroarchaeum sulfurireducens]|uniref:Metal dependent phosphohydrolase n=1 Tax=Halanaeroarchaeum sulfurireducens TaxID=1604004 RepID=A0A0F7PB17_9EURY|nr:HD domain-containing protein [Halanaeroarchaeum sulfurireducens]AKH98351.1 metal dependent phosphohydrolase [Halanaeroarchaeum sulfurireducens]ALG82745.1 metal dependent phosphohydrolase [Halanaeroarchaeum sulfurireducens]
MAQSASTQVREAFPELDSIDDTALRSGVIDAWTTAMTETDVDDLAAVPWFPPVQQDLGIEDETLIDHVRDVTIMAADLAATLLERRATTDLSMDTVLAGALVHDVSKLYEFDGKEATEIERYLGHPHYGVHVVAAADLPATVGHVVLSHSGRTSVEPATLEAEIVRRADEVAASAIRLESLDDLRNG